MLRVYLWNFLKEKEGELPADLDDSFCIYIELINELFKRIESKVLFSSQVILLFLFRGKKFEQI